MAKMAESLVLAAVLVGSIVGSAFAQTPAPAQVPPTPDCPAMIKSIRDQISNRLDAARYTATGLAAQAEALYKDNKVADCIAKAQEAAKAAGLAMSK